MTTPTSPPGPGGATLAAALVETNRILPVLDGFDEIATGLHRAALEALNATTLPLLLTSRGREYEDAVAGTDVLTAAAGVELTDLTTADLADYLPRTRKAVWQPVLAALRADPGGDLAAVLSTPLMVLLARTIYSDAPDRDPAELLDTARFPTREALADHLLGNFVPTVYRQAPRREHWDLDRVHRWLGYLANHLSTLGTHDLAWWQLGTAMRRRTRVLVVGLAVALVIGLVELVVESAMTVAVGLMTGRVAAFLIAFAAVLGLVCGAAFAFVYDVLATPAGTAFEPSRVRFRFRLVGGTPVRRRRRPAVGLVGGFLLGFGFGLTRDLMRGLMLDLWPGPVLVVVNAVVFGFVFALLVGLMFWLASAVETPLDLRSAASPAGLLLADRANVRTLLLMAVPLVALVVSLLGWLVVEGLQALPDRLLPGITVSWTPAFGFVLALVAGIGGGLAYVLSLTAWGHWVVFARVWLPLTGRLPWAVSAFLDDAYRRGVLRRAGAVYQFRHARLEEHLSRAHSRVTGHALVR